MTYIALPALFTMLLFLTSACAQSVAAPTETDLPEVAAESNVLDTPRAASASPDATALPPTTAEPSPTAAETSEVPATATTQLVTISAGEETMSIVATDGLLIQTTLFTPGNDRPAPGVILLHMLGSNRAAWGPTNLIDTLLANGFAVLTVDMRGHGETGGTADWSLAEDDLMRVWNAFTARPEVDSTRTAVVGASIGSNMALITAANQPAIRAAVLLSPGLDYRGATTADRLAGYGDRPLLIVASNEDSYAADSSRTLAEGAGPATQLTLYEGAGHGTQMFGREEGLVDLISNFLQDSLAE